MAINNNYQFQSPSMLAPLATIFPVPIVAKRAPTTSDMAPIGTLWVQPVDTNGNTVNGAWILTSIIANSASWEDVTGGAGAFNSIALPNTNAAGTSGVITFGGVRFVSNFGTNNTFIGGNSGNTTTTGTDNTALGTNALAADSTGADNTGIGFNALALDTTGGTNTAVGSGAAGNLTTGSSNSAFGYNALGAGVVTGGSNVAIGRGALNALTSSSFNTALGTSAGTANTTGASNVYIGASTSSLATTGSNNTVVGSSGGGSVTTGSNNTMLGFNVGVNYVTGTESSNIIIANAGVNGESNVMRLGTAGSSSGQVNTTFIAGPTMNIATDAIASTIVVGNNTTTTSVTLTGGTGGIVLSAAGTVSMVPGTVSAAAYAATLNTRVGAVTLTGQVLASAATQVLTITNSVCTTTSQIFVTVGNLGTNDAQLTMTRVQAQAGSFLVTVKNNGAAALNGDIHVTYWIIN